MNVPVGSLVQTSVVIANTQALSTVITTNGASLVGLMLPAAFTGSAITFLACNTLGGTYEPVYNSAGQISYTVAASRYIAIDPKDFQGILFLKLQSGSNEAANRTIVCSMKGIG